MGKRVRVWGLFRVIYGEEGVWGLFRVIYGEEGACVGTLVIFL